MRAIRNRRWDRFVEAAGWVVAAVALTVIAWMLGTMWTTG